MVKKVKKAGPRLRDLATAARGGEDAGSCNPGPAFFTTLAALYCVIPVHPETAQIPSENHQTLELQISPPLYRTSLTLLSHAVNFAPHISSQERV